MVMKTCQSSIKQSTQQRGREKSTRWKDPECLVAWWAFLRCKGKRTLNSCFHHNTHLHPNGLKYNGWPHGQAKLVMDPWWERMDVGCQVSCSCHLFCCCCCSQLYFTSILQNHQLPRWCGRKQSKPWKLIGSDELS